MNNTRQQFAETLDRAPAGEPERQYYFLDRLREVVEKKKAEEGFSATFHIETYGCQMNAKDSEKLCGILLKAGFTEVESEHADFVLYNTCTVRENANQ